MRTLTYIHEQVLTGCSFAEDLVPVVQAAGPLELRGVGPHSLLATIRHLDPYEKKKHQKME